MSPEAKRLRIVIDTNVLFSAAALPKDSPPSQILNLVRAGRVEAFVSPFMLGELEKNLSRKAHWEEDRIQALRKRLIGFLAIIEPKSHTDAIKSCEADNRVLECAMDARVDVLVTGNMKDIRPLGNFHGFEILSPREFMDKYFS